MKRALVVVLAVLAALTGSLTTASAQSGEPDEDIVGRIVGGTEVSPPGKYPFQVALVTPGDFQFCGGSLIDHGWVLTAAHCVTNSSGDVTTSPDLVDVIIGRHDLTTAAGQRRDVTAIHVHPNWPLGNNAENADDDIALLQLASPATLGTPIQLARASESGLWANGQPGTVIGWGSTIGQPCCYNNSTVLNEVGVPFISDAICNGPTMWNGAINPAEDVCAGGVSGEDSCVGDSGGPLFAPPGAGNWKQVGIVSFGGALCGDPTRPGVYTEVSAYIDWIDDYVNLDPTPIPPDPTMFVGVPPTRQHDTRGGSALLANSTRVFQITNGVVPSNATAAFLNVTATESKGAGFIQVFPTGGAVIGSSSTSNLDFAGQTIPNAAFAPLSADGEVSVFTTFETDIIIDVFGYFVPAPTSDSGRLVSLPGERILDSRSGLGVDDPLTRGNVVDDDVISLQVAGVGGVPASGASAVAMNVTAVSPTSSGFIQVSPTPVVKGAFSNLNPEPGRTIANLVVVPLGAGGKVDLFTRLYSPGGSVDLLGDVVGYFTDDTAPATTSGLFVPIKPTRVKDTRIPGGSPKVPAGGIVDIDASSVALGASAIAGNLTATGASASSFLQLAPKPVIPGATSSLNTSYDNQTIANAVVSQIATGEELQAYTFRPSHILLDITGFFTS